MTIFDRPTSKELLEAVLGFVNEEIESNDYTKDNRFKFLIVMNVLNIVKREVNLGRKIDESFCNKGLDLLKEDNFSVKKISEKIRNEELSIEDQPLLDFLYDLTNGSPGISVNIISDNLKELYYSIIQIFEQKMLPLHSYGTIPKNNQN